MQHESGRTLRRAVAVIGTTLLLVIGLTVPAMGGVVCTLQATVGGGSATEVPVGETVLIEGFGFPASVDVELTYDVDGTVIGGETASADAGGAFETSVVPQPGEEGLWTVTATVVKGCTATTGFLVVGAPATPTPSPTPLATPAPTPAPTQGELPNVAMVPTDPQGPWLATLLILGLALIAGAAIVAAPRRR